MITNSTNVFAATDTIQLGKATKTKDYIAGVSFFYKVTSDGQYLYCLNMHKETATNVKANMVKNSKNITGGLIYILKNGYPNKSITGDKEKDINHVIDLQEQYYKDIGMPISLRELGVKETDLEYLANRTSRDKTRIIPGYKPLGYEELLDIFKLAY